MSTSSVPARGDAVVPLRGVIQAHEQSLPTNMRMRYKPPKTLCFSPAITPCQPRYDSSGRSYKAGIAGWWAASGGIVSG